MGGNSKQSFTFPVSGMHVGWWNLITSVPLIIQVSNPGAGGTLHMKGVGMLVSIRGVNFAFWSHLGCSGQNATIFSREGLA